MSDSDEPYRPRRDVQLTDAQGYSGSFQKYGSAGAAAVAMKRERATCRHTRPRLRATAILGICRALVDLLTADLIHIIYSVTGKMPVIHGDAGGSGGLHIHLNKSKN